MESGNEFVQLVKAMRNAQVKSFLTKTSADMRKARKHEAKVDDYLRIFQSDALIDWFSSRTLSEKDK